MYIKCRITHTLLAIPLLKEHTYHRLWIDPERHLLDLYGFEQFRRLSLCILGRLLLPLSLGLLLPLPFLLGGASARGLALQSLNVFLCLATLLVLHAERLVRHDLCSGRLCLLILVLWRHVVWDRGGGGVRSEVLLACEILLVRSKKGEKKKKGQERKEERKKEGKIY